MVMVSEKWQAANGTIIEVRDNYPGRRKSGRQRKDRWDYRFLTSKLWFRGGGSILDTLIHAAWHCRKSAKAMDWRRLET